MHLRELLQGSEEHPIRLVVATGNATLRGTLKVLMVHTPGLQLVDIARNGIESIQACDQFHPDVALIDLQLPGIDGLQATRYIRQYSPQTRVVMIALMPHPHVERAALEAGASCLATRSNIMQELVRLHQDRGAASALVTQPI